MTRKQLFIPRNLLTHKGQKHFPSYLNHKLWQFILEIKLTFRIEEQIKTLLSSSLLLLFLFLLTACQSNISNSTTNESQAQNVGRLNTELTLNDAVLEQSNAERNLIWKIKAKRTTYSDDRQIAYLKDITANLLQNKKIILKVRGQQGEVLEQGNLIILKDRVLASDARNKTVLRGNLVEWRPLENLLIIQDNLQGNHPNLIVTANTAKYFTDIESLELTGQVVANTLEPSLLLESDRLLWQIPQQKVIANNPLEVVRYQKETIIDRLVADKGAANLSSKTIALSNNIEFTSVQPKLQIATNSAIWNYERRYLDSDLPIQIVARKQQLTVTGNQGQIDFETEIATLKNGVRGINNREQSDIYARQAIWNIPEKEIIATGDVVYNKTRPKINLRGDKAVIDLETNKAIVTSDRPQNKPVVSVVSD